MLPNGVVRRTSKWIKGDRSRLRTGLLWLPLLSVVCGLFGGGCGQPQASPTPSGPLPSAPKPQATAPKTEPAVGRQQPAVERSAPKVAAGYAPVRLSILPLTELTEPTGTSSTPRLHVFLALLDAFDSPIKAPKTVRFELYQYVPRSADPKGQRVAIWPDMDMMEPAQNNRYWRDFLRAYEFELDVQAELDKTYILEATCIDPEGKRLSTDYMLKPGM